VARCQERFGRGAARHHTSLHRARQLAQPRGIRARLCDAVLGRQALDGGVVPPPMYVPDPNDLGGYAALPEAVATDIVPPWPRWFAGASGLIMTRTLPSGTATMQPSAGLTTLTTSSAAATWPGGLDFQVGRWMGEQQNWALEGIYWGVYGLGTSATVTGTGINAIPQAPGVILAGSPASAFLTDATQQQVARSDLVNDVEINWLYRLTDRPEFLPLDRRLGFMWLAGFRFFELQDVLSQTSTSSASSRRRSEMTSRKQFRAT
jgi:hypothetical protein